MHSSLSSLCLALALLSGPAFSKPVDHIFGRALGDTCTGSEGSGQCESTSKCKGISYNNLCPNDPNDVKCCVEIACTSGGGSGFCRSKSRNGCDGGEFRPGTSAPWPCPGGNDIQCCVTSGGGGESPPPPPPPPSDPPASGGGDDIGAKVLAKAMEAAGTPYTWGGGSCSGPTGTAEEPEKGFDCSGLVSWALCKVTGRNLFSEGLRVTRTMYCASEGKLKYKKVPYSQRKAGDAVFFGGKCDCENDPRSIHHVGLMMDSGDRMWNAPNDRVNKVLEQKISSWGEEPCPQVIRFS